MTQNRIEKILKTMNILYIEEDEKYRVAVGEALKIKLNKVYSANNIKSASEIYNKEIVDIIVTDLLFTNRKIGINFINNIRKINTTIPIIVISSINNIDDIISLFRYNITDYIRKPIKLSKLKESLYYGVQTIVENGKYILHFEDNVQYNVQKNILSKDNIEIELTANERKLLNYFVVNKNYILSKDEIINFIWPDRYDITDSAFKSLISRLRLKIGKKTIKNSSGNGYILEINK